MADRTGTLAGTTAVVGLLAGVPAALVHLGGWPIPDRPSTEDLVAWIHEPLTPGFLAGAALCTGWLLWALLAATVAARIYTSLARARRFLPPLHLPGPLQGLTAAVLGATAVSATAAATPAHAAGTVTAPEDTDQAQSDAAASIARTVGRPAPPPTATAQDATGRPATVRVHRGDTLSRIAERYLGDADRWPDIFAVNRGARFPTVGGALTRPDLIYPGWTLRLPAATAAPHTDNPPRPSPPPAQPAHPDNPGCAPATAPPAPSSPAATSPAPGPSTRSTTPDADRAIPQPATDTSSRRPSSKGVGLPGGSWVDLGLAAAVMAAAGLVWAHRRRRYIPRPPSPDLRLDDPTVAPMPDVVTRIRRGLRRSVSHLPADGDGLQSDDLADDDGLGSGRQRDLAEAGPPPVTPALANPLIEVWPPAGLGLTGPGAAAAARGFLVAALAAGGLDDPDARSSVVVPSGTLATLLGATAVTVPDTPRLAVTGGLPEALTLLEEETLHRTRMCFDYEVDTIAGLRDADPMAEPLAPMVLIADTTAARERARVTALLTQGQRLDIHGILLGAWPDGNTVAVAADGTTTIPADGDAARHGSHPADTGRLAVLDPAETADLLTTLAESHTGEPPAPAPAEHPPLVRTGDKHRVTAVLEERHVAVHNDEKNPFPADPASATPDQAPTATNTTIPVSRDATVPPAAPPAADDGESASIRADADDQPADDGKDLETPAGSTSGHVEVQLLGAARVVDKSAAEPLRGKALELLVYLAARGGTTSQETILEDLLPEATTRKAPHRLHTYVYNLRRVLKRTGGTATYLSHPDRRYILHRDAVDVDLWRMREALAEATAATSPAARIAALRRAVDAYQGPLADGKAYEWIEPYREAVQRQAVDAALALADALTDQPGEALAVLTTAITHSPYAEPLYQAAMRAHAALGDTAAIRDLQRQLARRLDEIDTEVSDETAGLAGALVTRVQRAQHGGESKPS